MFRWASRCLPGFSIIALIVLLVATSNSIPAPWKKGFLLPSREPAASGGEPTLNLAQKIFTGYTVLVHTNMLAFAARLTLSLWYVTKKTKDVLSRRTGFASDHIDSPTSPTRDLPDPPAFVCKTSDPTVYDVEDTGVVHAIILPNYAEDVHTLTTTLNVLASHPRARSRYEVHSLFILRLRATNCLDLPGDGTKEDDAADKASKLISNFEKSFLSVCSTFHPSGLQGEIAGKSSNVAFAAHHIVQVHRAELNSGTCNVIVTVMDADTHLWQDYFTELRRLHQTHLTTTADRTLYSCPIIFDRNAHETPLLVRCADLLWSFAGLSTMYPGTRISIPTSVYSLPLSLAERVGGWDSDPTAIGEDMHMLLKCYFETAGDLLSRVVYVPASQCNVSGNDDAATKRNNFWPSYRATLSTHHARYRQALRHMWGALDSGFATRRTVSYLHLHTRCLFLRPRHLGLLHLLWEAHFLPTHLTIIMLFSALCEMSTPTHSLHPTMRTIFLLTAIFRTISFLIMNINFSLYNAYHTLCLQTRRADMLRTNLHDTGFARRCGWEWKYLAERVAFPVAGTVFGAVPTVQAVFAHFWTERLVYRVSRKPDFASATAASMA